MGHGESSVPHLSTAPPPSVTVNAGRAPDLFPVLVPGLFPVPVPDFSLLFPALALVLVLAALIPGLAAVVSVARARAAVQSLAAAGVCALPSLVAGMGMGAVTAGAGYPEQPAGEAFPAAHPAGFDCVVVDLALFPAVPGRAFFVPTAVECARGPSCHGVGNGIAADAGSAAALPGDNDFLNTAVDNRVVGRAAARSGDPSDPSRDGALPSHAPSDDPSGVGHSVPNRKSTSAAAGSSAREYAG